MASPSSGEDSSLLYELVLHGHGWRYEQLEQPAHRLRVGEHDSWATVRELSKGESLPSPAAGGDSGEDGAPAPAAGTSGGASRRLEAAAVQQWARVAVQAALDSSALSLALALGQQALAWPAERAPPSLPRWAAWERGLPFAQEALLRNLPHWRLALAPTGNLLAIWQSRQLVLLSARDGFTSPIALWRCADETCTLCFRRILAWSRDGTLLAAAAADGTVHVFDARLRILHRLPHSWWGVEPNPDAPQYPPLPSDNAKVADAAAALGIGSSLEELLAPPPPASPPLLGLAWREASTQRGEYMQLLLLSSGGTLHRINIPLAAAVAVHGARPEKAAAPSLSLVPAFHGFVTSLAYCPLGGDDEATSSVGCRSVGLLVVGGGGAPPSKAAALVQAKAIASDARGGAAGSGLLPSLSIWSIHDEPPYACLLFTSTSDPAAALAHSGGAKWSTWLTAPMRALRRARAIASGVDVPHCLALTSNGSHLAVLTLSGQLSVWNLSTLHPAARAPVAAAATAVGVSQRTPEPPLVYDGGPIGSDDEWISVSWWGKGALLLPRRSGSVSVAALPGLREMLGDRPESFAPMPLLSEAKGNPTSFFVLTRETFEAARLPPSMDGSGAVALSADAAAAHGRGGGDAVSDASAYMDRKSTAGVRRRIESWWLYSLRRTTPEAMFERKVGLKEYGDALTWARHYGFSADPVRQAQWRDGPVSSIAVADYLARVTQLKWVLNECCSRLSDDTDALFALLSHGIRRCDDALSAAAAESTDEQVALDARQRSSKDSETKGMVTAGSMSELQPNELHAFRYRLLRYRKRLRVWLAMAEAEAEAQGAMEAPTFDSVAHAAFRDKSLTAAAAQFAREQRFAALAVLFRAYARVSTSHSTGMGAQARIGSSALTACGWVLRVLSEVPEVTPPVEYELLLTRALHDVMTCAHNHEKKLERQDGADGSDEQIDEQFEEGLAGLALSPSVEVMLSAQAVEIAAEDAAEEFEEGLAPTSFHANGVAATVEDFHQAHMLCADGREVACAWLCERVRQIDARCGLLDRALELAEIGSRCVEVSASTLDELDEGPDLHLDLRIPLEGVAKTELHPEEHDPRLSLQGGPAAMDFAQLLGRLRQLYPLVYELGAPTSLASFERLRSPGRLALLLDLGATEATDAVSALQRVQLAPVKEDSSINAPETLEAYGSFLRRRVWPFLCHEANAVDLLRSDMLRRLSAICRESVSAVTASCNLTYTDPVPTMLSGGESKLCCTSTVGDAEDVSCSSNVSALLHAAAVVYCSRLSLPRKERLLVPVEVMLRTAVDVSYLCTRCDDEALEILTAMYASLPRRHDVQEEMESASEGLDTATGGMHGVGARAERISVLLDQVDELGCHLRAERILASWHLTVPMVAFHEASDSRGARGLSAKRAQGLLRRIARSVAKVTRRVGSGGGDGGAAWLAARDDMLALRELACPATPPSLPFTEWLHALLLAGHFSLAADALREAIKPMPARSSDVSSRHSSRHTPPRLSPASSAAELVGSPSLRSTGLSAEPPALTTSAAEALVLSAAREYFDGASDGSDSALEAASRCIRVLPSPLSADAARELALVDAAQLAAALGSPLVPLQLRRYNLATEGREILLSLASSVADPVAALPQLESLAAALAVASGNGPQAAEVDALHTNVAAHALSRADTITALRLAAGLVSRGFGPAWTVCEQLCDVDINASEGTRAANGQGDQMQIQRAQLARDLVEARPALLAHVLAHCPADTFSLTMERWRRAAAAAPGTAQAGKTAPAVSASRDPALALALSCDRPSAEKISRLHTQLSASVSAAGAAAAPAALRRVCRLGQRAYAVALAAAAHEPAASIRRTSLAPSNKLAAVVSRCTALLDAEAQLQPSKTNLAYSSDVETSSTATPFSPWRAAHDHFLELQRIEARLAESELLQPHLPQLNVAAYATNEADRSQAIRALARCSDLAAFQLALKLVGTNLAASPQPHAESKPKKGSNLAEREPVVEDESDLLAALEAAAAREEALAGAGTPSAHSSAYPDADAALASLEIARASSEIVMQGAASAAFGEELNEWILRMERVEAILWEALNAMSSAPSAEIDAAAVDVGSVMGTMRSAIKEHTSALLLQPVQLCVRLTTVIMRWLTARRHDALFLFILGMLLDAELRLRARFATFAAARRSIPASYDRDHNAKLLLALRQLVGTLSRVGAELNLLQLLEIMCVPLASAVSDADHTMFCRLGLRIAPGAAVAWKSAVDESTAVRLALVAPEILALVQMAAHPSEVASARALFCSSSVWSALAVHRLGLATSDPDVPYRTRLGHRRAAAALFPRIWHAHLRELLLPMTPGDIPLCGSTGAAAISHLADGSGSLALDELCSLIDASLPVLRAQALHSLAFRAVAAAEGTGSADFAGRMSRDAAASLREVLQRRRHLGTLLWLQKQVAVAVETEAERRAGGKPAARIDSVRGAVAAASLLGRWAAADGVARAERSVLMWQAADAADAPAVEVYSLLVALHGRWRVELTARDEGERVCDIVDATGDVGIDALLDKASRQKIRSVWTPSSASEGQLDHHVDRIDTATSIFGCAPLRLAEGSGAGAMRAAAALVSRMRTEARNSQHAAAEIPAPTMPPIDAQLSAIAGLMRIWRVHIEFVNGVHHASPDGELCPLHEQWLDLLLCAVELGGGEAVLRVRMATEPDRRRILMEEEERRLRSAIMAQAAESSGSCAQGASPHEEARLACVKCVLLSRNKAGVRTLVRWLASTAQATPDDLEEWARGSPPPRADAHLALLLLRSGMLDSIACSTYWTQIEPHLATCLSETDLEHAVGVLVRKQLFEAAGAMLLKRYSTHPMLCSTAAKFAAISAFVHARAEAIAADAGHPLRALWQSFRP